MGIKLLKIFSAEPSATSIRGSLDHTNQMLTIESSVVDHVKMHRQMRAESPEAGGQLFGVVSQQEICVAVATGPYWGDERSRYHYRSNPRAAQRAINKQARKGLLYLGEWHTHAEPIPSASDSDKDAMQKLLEHSELNVNSLLLMIVGQSSDLDGTVIYTYGGSVIDCWTLHACPSC